MDKMPLKFQETEREKIVQAAKITIRKPEGKKALDYLINRNLSNAVIDKFDIGYCPMGVNHVLRGRIIHPIYDTYGKLVALSTRSIEEGCKKRFLHESFDKGSFLYGLFLSKDSIRKNNKAIVVEGELDVAVLHSFGFTMTVGCCGSAFTLFQVSLLSKYCSDIYLMFDGDESGRKSIERAMSLYSQYDLDAYKLKFIPVFLPKDQDPDEYLVKNGSDKFLEKLDKSKEDSEFLI